MKQMKRICCSSTAIWLLAMAEVLFTLRIAVAEITDGNADLGLLDGVFSYWPLDDVMDPQIQDINGRSNLTFTGLLPEEVTGIKGNAVTLKESITPLQMQSSEGSLFMNPSLAFRSEVSKCGGTITKLSGCITSPNYPQHYGNNLECIWVFNFSKTVNVTFSFLDFSTEVESNCSYDQLTFYESSQQKLYGPLCGMRVKPFTYYGPKSTLYLRFKTDFSNVFKGFLLQYSADGKNDSCKIYSQLWTDYASEPAPTELALSLWIKDLEVDATGGYILTTAVNRTEGIGLFVNTTHLMVSVHTELRKWEASTDLPDTSRWLHVTFSWSPLSNTGLVLLINGTKKDADPTGTMLSLSAHQHSFMGTFNVTVDELAIFTNALSEWKVSYYYLVSTGMSMNTASLLNELEPMGVFDSIQDVNATLNKLKYLLSGSPLSPDSMKNTVKVLKMLVSKLPDVQFEPRQANSTAKEYFTIVDVLLNSSTVDLWESIIERGGVLNSLINSTDLFLFYLVSHLDSESRKNMVALGDNGEPRSLMGIIYANMDQALGPIPPSSTKMSQGDSKDFFLVSSVISASVSPLKGNVSAILNVITSPQNISEGNISLHCAFLDFREKDAVWSSEGCILLHHNESNVVCKCDHLTNFGILMQVVPFEIPVEYSRDLFAISFIGCLISIAALILNLLFIMLFGSFKDSKSHLNGNMSVAVLFAQINLLVGDMLVPSEIPCRVAAIVLHYLYLSAFFWILCKGLYLKRAMKRLFYNDYNNVGYYYFIGWGVPLIFCAATVPAAFHGYGTENNCWLSITMGTIWTFVAPALAVICINLFILVKVSKEIFTSSIVQVRTDHSWYSVKASFRVVAVLTPVLGITWIFGIFAVNESVIIFQYLFSISNSLQGLFIFMLHCVLNKDMRMRILKCRFRHQSQLSSMKFGVNSYCQRQNLVTVAPFSVNRFCNQEELSDSGNSSPSKSVAWSEDSFPPDHQRNPSVKCDKQRKKSSLENCVSNVEFVDADL
ncbi:adhesion G-protein coupled receptor D1-like isoform X2 [Protopterus annectens]|uniref:adhesion G-protein coupled receptor D1-like isoform X2 n=1 Tax=Protopterus annectens TaxID=7888 RepID=UPI001CF97BB4|nr:adhesion G-protein coupled receptor D1-like isoform X2 [Protopterus annectens]